MRTNMRRIRKVHLIGIGGVGMGGIAEVLHNCGYEVTGSDQTKSSMTERLSKLGISIAYSHIAENVVNSDAVVFSSAVAENNIELVTARKVRIPIVPRAEMLAELMRFKQGIAVAGTHGKTTTTSLVASILGEANLDPTFVIGGQLNSMGVNARLGLGEYFVAEADESDVSFLHLSPMIAVVTNIDRDHLKAYNDDFELLKKSFIEFLHRLPFYGLAIMCIDDSNVREIIPKVSRPILTYGFSEDADIQAMDFKQVGTIAEYSVKLPWQDEPIKIKSNLVGSHNVLNSLAALAVASEIGVSFAEIKAALQKFQGIKRRFQQLGEFNLATDRQVLLLDDYGHHSEEVKVVIKAIRQSWPGKRLVMLFQPHRYSRLHLLFEDFAAVLSEVDSLVMLEVYSAGEEPIAGIDSRSLCGSIRNRGKVDPIFVADKEDLLATLENILHDGDILLTQGAGDIGKIASYLAQEFAIKDSAHAKTEIKVSKPQVKDQANEK